MRSGFAPLKNIGARVWIPNLTESTLLDEQISNRLKMAGSHSREAVDVVQVRYKYTSENMGTSERSSSTYGR